MHQNSNLNYFLVLECEGSYWYRCKNGGCYPKIEVQCNGVRDCDGGEDEVDCRKYSRNIVQSLFFPLNDGIRNLFPINCIG